MTKPKNASVTRSKQVATTNALAVLRDFYLETRKELKKNETPVISLNKDDKACQLSFHADSFNLSLIITEGGLS